MEKFKIGLAMCGSYCTYDKAFAAIEKLAEKYDITPIMSDTAIETDTRFGNVSDHVARLEKITGKKVVSTIKDVEPLAPNGAFDLLVIVPCTGRTMAALNLGYADSAATMAAKGVLRNSKPVVIAFSTNDALASSAPHIAGLLNRKNIYFVPFGQDDYEKKPFSMASDFTLIDKTIESALKGQQLQPILA